MILTSYVPGHRRRSVVVYWMRLLINDNEQQLTRGAEFEFGRLFFGFPNLSQSPLFCCPTLPCLPLISSWVAGILVLVVGRCRIQMTSTTTTIHHPLTPVSTAFYNARFKISSIFKRNALLEVMFFLTFSLNIIKQIMNRW